MAKKKKREINLAKLNERGVEFSEEKNEFYCVYCCKTIQTRNTCLAIRHTRLDSHKKSWMDAMEKHRQTTMQNKMFQYVRSTYENSNDHRR